MWLPTCSVLLATGSTLSHVFKLWWAQAWHTTGRESCFFPTIFPLSATGLSAAGFVGTISHGTSSIWIPTVISTATVNAMPLMKVRICDQTLNTTSGGGKKPAVIAASREVLCHSCWTYVRSWYYLAINKNSCFVLWFIHKKSIGLDTIFVEFSCSTQDSRLNLRCS